MRASLYFMRMPRAQEVDERYKKFLLVWRGFVSIPRKFHENLLRISVQYVSCSLARYLKALCTRFGNTSAPEVHIHTYLLMYLKAVKHLSASYLNLKTSSLSMRASLYLMRMPRAQEYYERFKKVTCMYGMVLWAFPENFMKIGS